MKKGLTLLEILVALAVLGIFTAALLGFVQSTLATNRAAQVRAQLLEELKDTAGYLVDTLQEAKVVLSSAQLNSQTCTPPSCLAVLIPEDGASCALRAYRLEDRSRVPEDYKAPNPWADAHTRMLREYRLNGLSCSAASFGNAQPYVVLDLVDNDPNLSLFQVSASPAQITLSLRLKARESSRVVYAPGSGQVYQVRVYPRNAP